LPRRAAQPDPGARPADRADHQLLQAVCERELGAHLDLVGTGQPHVRLQDRRSRAVAASGVPDTRRRRQPVPRLRGAACRRARRDREGDGSRPRAQGKRVCGGTGGAVSLHAARSGRPLGVERVRSLDVRRRGLGPLPQLRAHRAAAVRPGCDRLRAAAHVRARMIEVIEPATEEVLAEVPRAGADDVDAAVSRAREAFPAWRAIAPAERAARLHSLADALAAGQEELARLEARNAGKPICDARGEMDMVAATFRYYAGAPERLLGETIPVAGGQALTVREPLGVVGLIVPWNFPLLIASWKLAPALAAGNTVVLKPAELTPLTALKFEQIAAAAGIPAGVANLVAGPG